LPPADIDEILQHVHTLKGEARSFELSELATETANLEEEVALVQGSARASGATDMTAHRPLWSRRLKRIREELERAEELFIAASPVGRAILDQITVDRLEVQRLNELLGSRSDEIGAIVRRLAARPFGEAVASLTDRVPGWAETVGKRARLEVDGKDVRVPEPIARALPALLSHLIRNAVAHGVETSDGRTAAGKPEVGVIRVRCSDAAAGPTIVVEDDGRGLPTAHLVELAALRGLPVTDPNELVFVPGLTTADAVSEMSGRGMGLSAVRAELESLGWTIQVDESSRRGTTFLLRPRPSAASSSKHRKDSAHVQG
jgi:chemotaxis protein histidine kinase CheA